MHEETEHNTDTGAANSNSADPQQVKLCEVIKLHQTLRSRIELEASHLQSLVNQSLQARANGVALPDSQTDALQQFVNLEII